MISHTSANRLMQYKNRARPIRKQSSDPLVAGPVTSDRRPLANKNKDRGQRSGQKG